VRKKVEKHVAADEAQERDTMAEVVDLRAKDMGVKGGVATGGYKKGGILNSMKCHSNEKRMEFADRLVTQFWWL
jgi:hypothetical protein